MTVPVMVSLYHALVSKRTCIVLPLIIVPVSPTAFQLIISDHDVDIGVKNNETGTATVSIPAV